MVTGGKLYEYDPTTEDWVEVETLKEFVTEDTTSVAFIDIDGDGDDDLVVARGPGQAERHLRECRRPLPRTAEAAAIVLTKTYDAQDVEYVDINNDDIPDLVIGRCRRPADLVYLGTGDPGNPTWGDDPGDDPLEIPGTDGVATKSIEVEDIDGDGDMDVVIAAEKDGYADVVVIFNDGTDPNNLPSDKKTVGLPTDDEMAPQDVEMVDVDGDDIPDVVIGNVGGPDYVYLSNGKELTAEDLEAAARCSDWG